MLGYSIIACKQPDVIHHISTVNWYPCIQEMYSNTGKQNTRSGILLYAQWWKIILTNIVNGLPIDFKKVCYMHGS